jgi:hypothetical protein
MFSYDTWKLASPPEPKGRCVHCENLFHNCECPEFEESED